MFLRKATGLVKGWSRFDAFLYSFMSVNFVTLGLFFACRSWRSCRSGQVLPAILISGVFITFLVITYAGLISVMPRAGGDYVWQSRVLGGGLAFLLAVTGWWFILWYWAPIYANILNVEVFQPLAAIFKWTAFDVPRVEERPVHRVHHHGALAGFLVSLGMEGYAKVQRVCFYIGMVGLVVIVAGDAVRLALRVRQRVQPESKNLFGARQRLREDVQGRREARQRSCRTSVSRRSSATRLLLIPFLCFWILWPNWGATLYGEVRGASDFKRVMGGMMYGLWVTIASPSCSSSWRRSSSAGSSSTRRT